MPASKADLILHPTRMRIILALAGRKMSALQLVAAMPDIPQATLYRHIKTLAKANILAVAEERRVRGTTETVYTLEHGGGRLSPQEFAKMSKDDHLRYFTAFLAGLLNDFSRYLDTAEEGNILRDGVGYNRAPLYLSDEEIIEISNVINGALLPKLNNKPGEGRRRRDLISIMIPIDDEPPKPATDSNPRSTEE